MAAFNHQDLSHYFYAKRTRLPKGRRARLYVADTKLTGKLSNESNQGLFTKDKIRTGDIIIHANHELAEKMNDPMVDLKPILEAKTHQQMYDVLFSIIHDYYDSEKIESRVNVRHTGYVGRGDYYTAIRSIAVDDELYRLRGLSVIFAQLFHILTDDTVVGCAKLINMITIKSDDPYYDKMNRFRIYLINITGYKPDMELDEYQGKIFNYSAESATKYVNAERAAYTNSNVKARYDLIASMIEHQNNEETLMQAIEYYYSITDHDKWTDEVQRTVRDGNVAEKQVTLCKLVSEMINRIYLSSVVESINGTDNVRSVEVYGKLDISCEHLNQIMRIIKSKICISDLLKRYTNLM